MLNYKSIWCHEQKKIICSRDATIRTENSPYWVILVLELEVTRTRVQVLLVLPFKCGGGLEVRNICIKE